MTILNTLAFAQELARHTGDAFVVIDAWNNGGLSNWPQSFPSLDDEQTEALGEPFAIRFDSVADAQAAFTRICADLVDEGRSGLVGANVHYVGRDPLGIQPRLSYETHPVQTVTFDSTTDPDRPVFEGGVLGREIILERL